MILLYPNPEYLTLRVSQSRPIPHPNSAWPTPQLSKARLPSKAHSYTPLYNTLQSLQSTEWTPHSRNHRVTQSYVRVCIKQLRVLRASEIVMGHTTPSFSLYIPPSLVDLESDSDPSLATNILLIFHMKSERLIGEFMRSTDREIRFYKEFYNEPHSLHYFPPPIFPMHQLDLMKQVDLGSHLMKQCVGIL